MIKFFIRKTNKLVDKFEEKPGNIHKIDIIEKIRKIIDQNQAAMKNYFPQLL